MLDSDTEWFSSKHLLKYHLFLVVVLFYFSQRICGVWHLSSSAIQVAGTWHPKLLCEL